MLLSSTCRHLMMDSINKFKTSSGHAIQQLWANQSSCLSTNCPALNYERKTLQTPKRNPTLQEETVLQLPETPLFSSSLFCPLRACSIHDFPTPISTFFLAADSVWGCLRRSGFQPCSLCAKELLCLLCLELVRKQPHQDP